MKGDSQGRLWSWVVALPLAGLLLWWSLRGVDWKAVWITLARARWELIAAASVLVGVSFFLRALRWRILLNAEENLPVGEVFCATMAGYMGNTFLPARAGEVIRTLVVSGRSSLTKTYVLTTALCERLMDVVALVLWASLILLGMKSKPDWMAGVASTMAIAAGLGAVAIAILPHTGELVQNLLRRFTGSAGIPRPVGGIGRPGSAGHACVPPRRTLSGLHRAHSYDLGERHGRGNDRRSWTGLARLLLDGASADHRLRFGQRLAVHTGVRRHLPICGGHRIGAVGHRQRWRLGVHSAYAGVWLPDDGTSGSPVLVDSAVEEGGVELESARPTA